MYAFAPEKPPGLVGRNFCLAILSIFASAAIFAAIVRGPAPRVKPFADKVRGYGYLQHLNDLLA
jgi:hypothetical protein